MKKGHVLNFHNYAMGQLGYLGKLALQEHFVRWGWRIEGE